MNATRSCIPLCTLLLLATIATGCGGGDGVLTIGPVPTGPFINEVLFDPNSATDRPNEYVEIRGIPNLTFSAGTYLVGVEGDTVGAGPGNVQTIFELSGLALGGSGFLTILMESTPYTADPGSTTLTGTPGGIPGFDSPRFTTGGLDHIEETSVTFFLITTSTPPTIADDIDSDDDGNPDGAVFADWTVTDSVSVLDDVTGGGDLLNVGYGDVIFAADPADAGFRAKTGAVVIDTQGVKPMYVGRIGNSTGATAADWVAGALTGTAPNYSLAAGQTIPAALDGSVLNHVGAAN